MTIYKRIFDKINKIFVESTIEEKIEITNQIINKMVVEDFFQDEEPDNIHYKFIEEDD